MKGLKGLKGLKGEDGETAVDRALRALQALADFDVQTESYSYPAWDRCTVQLASAPASASAAR